MKVKFTEILVAKILSAICALFFTACAIFHAINGYWLFVALLLSGALLCALISIFLSELIEKNEKLLIIIAGFFAIWAILHAAMGYWIIAAVSLLCFMHFLVVAEKRM